MSALSDLLKQKKQDLAAASGRGKKVAKIPDGKSRWRILASWRGAGEAQFWHDFGQHFVKNAANVLTAVYVCTEKTFGRPCPICEAIAAGTAGATDDMTMKLMKEARSAAKILVNAIHLDGPNPTEVQILELGPTAFGMVCDIAQEYEENGDALFDHDLIFGREGTGLNTKYTVMAAAVNKGAIPANPKLNDLDAYVQQESQAAETKALNSVRTIAGLLPAPARTSGLPVAAATAATLVTEEDEYATAPAPSKRAMPADDEITDVPDSVTAKPVAAPAPKKVAAVAAPAPAPVTESTGDAELDALIDSIEN